MWEVEVLLSSLSCSEQFLVRICILSIFLKKMVETYFMLVENQNSIPNLPSLISLHDKQNLK